MAKRKEIVAYLDGLLAINDIPKDASNNGLQVEGGSEVNKIIFSVDGSQQLINKAVKLDADMIFTHHGLSWGDSLKRINGMNASRLRPLFKNDISFYAAHLPLDAHQEVGHNACLAKMLGIEDYKMFARYAGAEIGTMGTLPFPMTPGEIGNLLDEKLGSKHQILGPSDIKISKVGAISGGAGTDGYMAAVAEGLECFVTGEIGHTIFHPILEAGVPTVFLGHYCSEKPGVFAVMDLVKEKFDVECEFIDIPTGL